LSQFEQESLTDDTSVTQPKLDRPHEGHIPRLGATACNEKVVD